MLQCNQPKTPTDLIYTTPFFPISRKGSDLLGGGEEFFFFFKSLFRKEALKTKIFSDHCLENPLYRVLLYFYNKVASLV